MPLNPAPGPAGLRIQTVFEGPGLSLLRGLLQEYRDWLGPAHDSPQLARDLRELPGPYRPPSGFLLLARLDDVAAGCIALRGLDAKEAELKRLFVSPDLRRRGIARALLDDTIRRARTIGYRALLLDMVSGMEAAHGLYAGAGFNAIAAYYPGARRARRFMRLDLGKR